MKRLYVIFAVMGIALLIAPMAFATPDATLTSAKSSLTSYFTENLPTVIAAFVAVALSIWLLRMIFRSVGVGRPKSVN